jgi:hypothetical protein
MPWPSTFRLSQNAFWTRLDESRFFASSRRATDRAVSLNEARRHMRVEDTDSDDLIAMYVEAAEQSLAYVGRALKPATYALDLYGHVFPTLIYRCHLCEL